jgi:uncharacterized membrane protein YbhN (UPF0104 family)
MTSGRRRLARLALSAAVLALLALFARHVDWRGAAAAIRDADAWLLLLAVAMNLLSLGLKGVRWWVFLRPMGVRSLGLVLRATFAGASLNNLLVAQGGEGLRVLLVSRASDVSSAHVLAALALERLLDAITYLMLLVGAAWLPDVPHEIARWRMPATGVLALALAGLAALTLWERAEGPDPARKLHAYLVRFAAGISELASTPRLAVALALSIGAWTLQVGTYHLVAVAAHLPLPLTGSVAALLTVGISFLVRATPGNVGVFQVVYALTARSFGIAETPAVATALLIQTVQVLPILVLGTVVTPGLTPKADSRLG